jgi:hypothetical protein
MYCSQAALHIALRSLRRRPCSYGFTLEQSLPKGIWDMNDSNAKQELAMQTNNREFRLALTRQETAKALGVNPITVDRLVARGLLRPCRALRRPLFPLPEIERFLKENGAE